MVHIVFVSIRTPSVSIRLLFCKFFSTSFRISPVLFQSPGDITCSEVIALKSQLYPIHVNGAVHLCYIQIMLKILHSAAYGIFRIGDPVRLPGILRVIAAF